MENLKEKIATEIKKLGMIKSTDSSYKMTKYSQEDIVDLVTELAENELANFSIKFMDYLDYHDAYKSLDGKYFFGKHNTSFTPEEVLIGFKSFLEINK